MGMIGCYMALDLIDIEKLAQGHLQPEDLDFDNERRLDIDKAWQGIHFWLCEELYDGAPPQGYIVPMRADQALLLEPYGAFYLYPQQVQQAVDWLDTMNEEQLRLLYRFSDMVSDEIYPIFEGEDEQEFYNYLHEYLLEIQKFYKQVAAAEQGVVFYIS
ncbi:YfbM family protein [Paenibacillus kandeliae]|uniref:YfbM family protein n=1 Tax=Paenibacillus kandeliae TaxID=3231269 RepID=UPI0034594F50